MTSGSNVLGFVVATLTGIIAVIISVILIFADRGFIGEYVAIYWGIALALLMFLIPVGRAFSAGHPNRYFIAVFAVLYFGMLNVHSAINNDSGEWYMIGWVVLWVWAFLPLNYVLRGEIEADPPK